MGLTLTAKRASEGDVVELVEDQPKYNFVRGQRAIVITEFDEPSEAYDLAVEDEDENFLGFAYSVRPDQIINLTREAFEQGMQLVESGEIVEAERQLEKAITFTPRYRGIFLNCILASYAREKDWNTAAVLLQLLVRIAPSYQLARNNLAIAYLNLGVSEVKKGSIHEALELFYYAIGVKVDEEITSRIRENFAASFTGFGIREHANGNHEQAMSFMRMACVCNPNEKTWRNLGVAHAHLARQYMGIGNYRAAVVAFQNAEEAGLLSADLLNDQAISLVFLGRLDEAARVFERAMRLEPENEILRENIAKLERREDSGNYIVEEIQPEYLPMPAVIPQSFASADAA